MGTRRARVRGQHSAGRIFLLKDLEVQHEMRILGERVRVGGSRAWIGCTGVDVDGFVGLSIMLNNISKAEHVSITGS